VPQAYVADISTDEGSRAKNLALLQGASLTGAFLVGFPLSVLISTRTNSYRIPVLVAAASQLVNMLVILLIPESKPRAGLASVKQPQAARLRQKATMPRVKKGSGRLPAAQGLRIEPPWAALRTLATPILRRLAVAYVLAIMAQSSLDDGFLLFAQARFGWGQQQVAPILILVGILLAGAPQLLIPHLGVRGSIAFGLPVVALGMAAICLAPTPAFFIAGICVVAVGFVCLPTMLVLLTSLVPDDQKGAALGAIEALKTLAKMLSASTTPAAFSLFMSDKAPLGIRLPGAPFGWASILALASYAIQMSAM
jgi:predicted MFS family arabinose efflux permease